MKINYVLIDYENLQPNEFSLLDREPFKVKVFLGQNQKNVPSKLAAALQPLGKSAEYINITGNGSNALDFHIAYYMGRLAVEEPSTYFHIISKDQGFDPLIEHLRSKKICASRWTAITEIPLIKVLTAKSPSEKVALIKVNLKQRGESKPGTRKTLIGTINSLFQSQLDEKEMEEMIKTLQSEGIIKLEGTKVSYKLPSGG